MNQPPLKEAGDAFARFVQLIARLRAPGGCPWDREQTHESLKPMTLEEAYEVVEAIDRRDDQELAGELGDLLLQVVFHAQLATEGGRFTIADVIERVFEKMVHRHPHVFADHPAATPGEVLRNWEAIKEEERDRKGKASDASMLDSVSRSLPATMEAFQMTTKVSRVGFDWPDVTSVLAKLEEEVGELKEAIAAGAGPAAVGEDGRDPDEIEDAVALGDEARAPRAQGRQVPHVKSDAGAVDPQRVGRTVSDGRPNRERRQHDRACAQHAAQGPVLLGQVSRRAIGDAMGKLRHVVPPGRQCIPWQNSR